MFCQYSCIASEEIGLAANPTRQPKILASPDFSSQSAVTITKPHDVGWTAWLTWVFPAANKDQEEDQEDDGFAAADTEKESPTLTNAETELKDSPIPDSI